MYIYKQHLYFVYIVTNHEKTVLYIGVTNNLDSRLAEHYFNKGIPKTFAGKFYCYNLIYFEEFQYVNDAICGYCADDEHRYSFCAFSFLSDSLRKYGAAIN